MSINEKNLVEILEKPITEEHAVALVQAADKFNVAKLLDRDTDPMLYRTFMSIKHGQRKKFTRQVIDVFDKLEIDINEIVVSR